MTTSEERKNDSGNREWDNDDDVSEDSSRTLHTRSESSSHAELRTIRTIAINIGNQRLRTAKDTMCICILQSSVSV